MGVHKAKRAVLVYLDEGKDGAQLRLDDVVLQSGQDGVWKYDVLYTMKPMSMEELEKPEFSDKGLSDLEFHVLARLRAFLKIGGELIKRYKMVPAFIL